uniref:Uncharacterized protein n=1 Tax=Lactuca sativa TaxID=4236 RepID=A0A9R1VTW2_LACSA|nr:hypothetical protein LSAT_V11C400159120 [Lactuca sativa]
MGLTSGSTSAALHAGTPQSIRKSECLEELRLAKGRAPVHASLVRKLEDYPVSNLSHFLISYTILLGCFSPMQNMQLYNNDIADSAFGYFDQVALMLAGMGSSADVDTVSKFIDLESLIEWCY